MYSFHSKFCVGKFLSCLKRFRKERWRLAVPYRLKTFYIEAAAASNITIPHHPVTFDPEASWLRFHLGITRSALYSRDDGSIDGLLRDMQTARVISAGQREPKPKSIESNACSISWLCPADFTQDEKALKGACDCSQGKYGFLHYLKMKLFQCA